MATHSSLASSDGQRNLAEEMFISKCENQSGLLILRPDLRRACRMSPEANTMEIFLHEIAAVAYSMTAPPHNTARYLTAESVSKALTRMAELLNPAKQPNTDIFAAYDNTELREALSQSGELTSTLHARLLRAANTAANADSIADALDTITGNIHSDKLIDESVRQEIGQYAKAIDHFVGS